MATATENKKNQVGALPFAIASRQSSRFSFSLGTTDVTSAGSTLSPVQLPAVGYLTEILLDVTVKNTGGSSPKWKADGPFNIISSIQLRNSKGANLITPITGYSLYLVNKYGAQNVDAPYCDPKNNAKYDDTVTETHFRLSIPCRISPADGFGAIPALSANRQYQVEIGLDKASTAVSGSPSKTTVEITGTAHYLSEPVPVTMTGLTQDTAPRWNGTLNMWQFESSSLTAGDKFTDISSVGNVIRTLIFVLRDSDGARNDTSWPDNCELILDNAPQFYLPHDEWQDTMAKQFGLTSGTADDVNGFDTGVFVIPFYAMAEGKAIANARRSQYLPTLDASQLQLRGTSWGDDASSLQVLTNSVQPVDPRNGDSARALYGIS